MHYIRTLTRVCGGLAVSAALSFGAVSGVAAAGIKPDCTDPAVNAYFRQNVTYGADKDGELIEDVRFKFVGTMKPYGRSKGVAKEGEEVACFGHVRAVAKSGHAATFEARVYFAVRNGRIDYMKFKLLPTR